MGFELDGSRVKPVEVPTSVMPEMLRFPLPVFLRVIDWDAGGAPAAGEKLRLAGLAVRVPGALTVVATPLSVTFARLGLLSVEKVTEPRDVKSEPATPTFAPGLKVTVSVQLFPGKMVAKQEWTLFGLAKTKLTPAMVILARLSSAVRDPLVRVMVCGEAVTPLGVVKAREGGETETGGSAAGFTLFRKTELWPSRNAAQAKK